MRFGFQSWVAALLVLACGCATRTPPLPPPAPAPAAKPPRGIVLTPPKQFDIHCALKVKGGMLEELQRSMAAVQTCLEVTVEPMGFRFFELPQTHLVFDAAKQELQVLLDKTVCAKQHEALTGAVARVAVSELDCIHFFDVDTATGIARQQERYEVDYVLSAKDGAPFNTWRNLALEVNGKPADWEDFVGDGLKFDWLPPVIKIKITGLDADGQKMKVEISCKNATLQTLIHARSDDKE